jgi:hypothetical protein
LSNILKNNNFEKFIQVIKIIFFSIILYFILNEIKNHSFDIENYKKNFNINFFLLATIFFLFTQFFSSSVMYLIINLISRIKYSLFFKILFTSQFLDYIPFLGLVYRVKKFKDKIKLSYINFFTIYIFLLLIGSFVVSSSIVVLFIFFDDATLFIDKFLFFFVFIVLLIVLFFTLSKKIFSNFSKNYYFNLLIKKINIFNFIIAFVNLKKKFITKKFSYVKCLILDLAAHFFFI